MLHPYRAMLDSCAIVPAVYAGAVRARLSAGVQMSCQRRRFSRQVSNARHQISCAHVFFWFVALDVLDINTTKVVFYKVLVFVHPARACREKIYGHVCLKIENLTF